MREKATPFEYLLKCSEMSLEDFELARLDRAASLRRQLRDIAEEWVDAAVEAQLARWVRENRRSSAVRPARFRECEPEDLSEREAMARTLNCRRVGRNTPPNSLPPAVPVAGRERFSNERPRFRTGPPQRAPRRQRRYLEDSSPDRQYFRDDPES